MPTSLMNDPCSFICIPPFSLILVAGGRMAGDLRVPILFIDGTVPDGCEAFRQGVLLSTLIP